MESVFNNLWSQHHLHQSQSTSYLLSKQVTINSLKRRHLFTYIVIYLDLFSLFFKFLNLEEGGGGGGKGYKIQLLKTHCCQNLFAMETSSQLRQGAQMNAIFSPLSVGLMKISRSCF